MTAEPEEHQQPSRGLGGCVAVVLAAGAVGVPFALAPEAGVLVVWAAGSTALWWAARRRVSDSSAPPPPVGVAPSGDVFAGETDRVARAEYSPDGVRFTIHPVREEVNHP